MIKIATKIINGLNSYISRSLLLGLCVLFINSCVNDIEKQEDETSMETIVFSIVLNPGIETREDDSYNPEKDSAETLLGDCQITRGKEINMIYYKAFETEEDELKESQSEISRVEVIDIKSTTIHITLDRTKAYKILFWAQHDESGDETFVSPYFLSEDMDVTINYENILNNDERLDAFYGALDYEWKTGKTPTEVRLYRPFAQVNVGSIIADWLPSGFYNKKSVRSQMTISNVASKFSIAKGKVIKEEGSSKYDIAFNFNDIFNGPTQDIEYLEPEEQKDLFQSFKNAFLYVDFNENGEIDQSSTTTTTETNSSVDWWRYERSRYISMAYFLVDSNEDLGKASDVVDVRFNIGYDTNEGNEKNETTFVIPFSEMIFDNVAVRPNYRTNIVGSLFSKQQRIFVNLSPAFDGIFTNRDEENVFDDTNRLSSNEKMNQEGFKRLLDAFYNDNESDISYLFERYGYEDKDRGVKCFVLEDDVEKDDILQIHWDYMLYGNGHTVKLHKYNSAGNYYNFGPVRNIYISDLNGNDKIYIDDNGYVWFLNAGGKWSTLWYQLYKLDGSQNYKSYNVYCTDGRVAKSDYYPPKYNK